MKCSSSCPNLLKSYHSCSKDIPSLLWPGFLYLCIPPDMKACFHRLPTTLLSSASQPWTQARICFPPCPSSHRIHYSCSLRGNMPLSEDEILKPLQPVPVANRPHVNGIYATRIAQQIFKFILTVYVIRKVRICKVFGISLNRIMCKKYCGCCRIIFKYAV